MMKGQTEEMLEELYRREYEGKGKVQGQYVGQEKVVEKNEEQQFLIIWDAQEEDVMSAFPLISMTI